MSRSETLVLWINRALESLWLLTIVLVPLVFLGRNFGEWSSIIGSFELPKITFLRTLAALMAALWLVEWALLSRLQVGLHSTGKRPRWPVARWPRRLREWLRARPASWLFLAVGLYVSTVLLSTALSASFDVSVWGDVPGQDSYSAYTVIAYVLIFGVVATHLKTQAQLQRILGALILMGVLVSGYGVSQHFGADFLDLIEPPDTQRVSSTMGNALFAASVMLMVIPITLAAAAINLRERLTLPRFWWKLGLWALALSVQLLAMVFTLSRGPWVGTSVALTTLLCLTLAFLGWRTFIRGALVLALAGVLTAASLNVPAGTRTVVITADFTADIPAATGTETALRVGSIGGQLTGGGLSGRLELWKSSWQLMVHRPWFEFDRLSLSPLRSLIGYGPELFRVTYLLVSPPHAAQFLHPKDAAHAHNYFLHQGVELGFLGLLSSLGVFVIPFLIGVSQLRQNDSDNSPVRRLMLMALLATLGGRFLEQLVGVARISDLTIFWVLLALFAALPPLREAPQGAPKLAQPPGPTVRRFRTRSTSARKAPGGYRHLILPAAAAAVLVVGMGALTWTKSINYFRAALISDDGAEQLRDGDLQGALHSLGRAIELAPDVSTYYHQRASLYFSSRNGNLPGPDAGCKAAADATGAPDCELQAQHSLNRSWASHRTFYFRSKLSLADSTLELWRLNGDPELAQQATQLYDQAAAMVPSSWAIWDLVASAYLQVGLPSEALSRLEKSLSITRGDQHSRQALYLQSEAYRDLGQPERAIGTLSEIIGLLPQQQRAYYDRAVISYGLGRTDAALQDLGQAIRLDPGYADAYQARGTVYYQLGRPLEAIGDLDEAIRLGPQHAEAYNNRGLAYARLGRLERAERDFTEAIRINPLLASAYNNRGLARRDLGLLEPAVADLAEAIKLEPKFKSAYYNRALAYALLGKELEARQDADRAIQLGFDPSLLEMALEETRRSR